MGWFSGETKPMGEFSDSLSLWAFQCYFYHRMSLFLALGIAMIPAAVFSAVRRGFLLGPLEFWLLSVFLLALDWTYKMCRGFARLSEALAVQGGTGPYHGIHGLVVWVPWISLPPLCLVALILILVLEPDEWKSARRFLLPLAVVLLDLALLMAGFFLFSRYNDEYIDACMKRAIAVAEGMQK